MLVKELENNAYFWQKVDALFLSGDFELLYSQNSRHPKMNNLIFPCDYGHVKTFDKEEAVFMRVFRGEKNNQVTAIVICANLLDREINNIVLVGVSREKEEEILSFLNSNEYQKTIIIRRGNDIPNWAASQ